MNTQADNLTSRWCRAGVLFNVPPASNHEPLDLEQLLVDTAEQCPGNPRLFIAALTWLTRHGTWVAAQRLNRLALDQLEQDDQATLGLLIETAVDHGAQQELGELATPGLQKASTPGLLFEVDREWFKDRADAEATGLSKRWGRWCQHIELKPELLRPIEWILAENPSFRDRADREEDLRS